MNKNHFILSIIIGLLTATTAFTQVKGTMGGKESGNSNSMDEIPEIEKAIVHEVGSHIQACLNRKGEKLPFKDLKEISEFIYAAEVSQNFESLGLLRPSSPLCADFKNQQSALNCLHSLPKITRIKIKTLSENTLLNPYLQGKHKKDFASVEPIINGLKQFSIENSSGSDRFQSPEMQAGP